MDPIKPDELVLVPLLAGLEPSDLVVLASRLEVQKGDKGHVWAREGQSGYAFYIVADGSLEVTIEGQPVRQIGPGDYFGEIAILGGGRRTATVTSTGPTTVWALFGTRFRELQIDHPDVATALENAMNERLASD
jgi:CRP-like cAMP-binding protein